jgi:UDP-N-acetylmuramoyl-tripeptide--D-alanyl-D-alanine ligase
MIKRLFRSSVAASLSVLAHLVVKKYKPTVIMVTGSVGKTSTKDALAAAMGGVTHVRASEKSYNSEFGVPFTIFGVANPWSNPVRWLYVYKEALALLLLPNHYPKMLVLEVGADRPGDLAKILHITLPDAVVVTRLPEVPVHVEAYASPEAVREEEFVPAYGLAPSAPLIVNADDRYALMYAKRLPISLLTFGFDKADISIHEAGVATEDGKPVGMKAVFSVGGVKHEVQIRGALGRQQLLAPAAALAVATALGFDAEKVLTGLAAYIPPAGRSRILNGKEGSTLIDDTYNASPAAVEEALHALSSVPAKRRIAVLGDMLELGRYSVAEHERIGALAAQTADVVVAVGIRARTLADAAKAAGMKEGNVYSCDSSRSAAELLPTLVTSGDLILIKGSQSIRTEHVTEALLADPKDSAKLVRQEKEWKER